MKIQFRTVRDAPGSALFKVAAWIRIAEGRFGRRKWLFAGRA